MQLVQREDAEIRRNFDLFVGSRSLDWQSKNLIIGFIGSIGVKGIMIFAHEDILNQHLDRCNLLF